MIPLSCPAVGDEGMRSRSEQAIGDLAQALLENPVFNQAISAAFGARDKALEAQHAAMGALNLPSASEVERLERRLRSLSERLEAVEEQVDRVGRDVAAIRRQLAGDNVDVGADQARLRVEES
jgi:chromosome segregation ATPase